MNVAPENQSGGCLNPENEGSLPLRLWGTEVNRYGPTELSSSNLENFTLNTVFLSENLEENNSSSTDFNSDFNSSSTQDNQDWSSNNQEYLPGLGSQRSHVLPNAEGVEPVDFSEGGANTNAQDSRAVSSECPTLVSQNQLHVTVPEPSLSTVPSNVQETAGMADTASNTSQSETLDKKKKFNN